MSLGPFLSCRPRGIVVTETFSQMRLTFTGSFQDCSISPSPHILYTGSTGCVERVRYLNICALMPTYVQIHMLRLCLAFIFSLVHNIR